MIQCIGPAEKYCARTCCTTALKNALKLKELKPERAGERSCTRTCAPMASRNGLYTEARRQGVLFVRYDDEHKPEIVEFSTHRSATSNHQGVGSIAGPGTDA